MAKQFPRLEPEHRDFIERQKIFFAASATAQSRVNVSPRSTDCLRVVGENDVFYLDRTGSSNETAAHMRADGRLTFMFCAVEGLPRILRLYGRGRSIRHDEAEFEALVGRHFPEGAPRAARQIIRLAIDLVQTSCGFGVPLFAYEGERDILDQWAEKQTDADIADYWRKKNQTSIDGLPTGLLDPAD